MSGEGGGVPQKVQEGAPRRQACPACRPGCVQRLPWPAALLFQLKNRAMRQCSDTAGAYADCCRGRTVSMVWACRAPLRDLNACLQQQCAGRQAAVARPRQPAPEAGCATQLGRSHPG